MGISTRFKNKINTLGHFLDLLLFRGHKMVHFLLTLCDLLHIQNALGVAQNKQN